MSMTRGELRTLALSWLDDPNGGYFTPAQMNVWLNNAQRELQKRLIDKGQNYYVQRMEGTMVAGVDTYTLPTDYKKTHKLEVLVDGTADTSSARYQLVTEVTLMELARIPPGPGIPCAVAYKRNAMILRPYPQQAYTMFLHQSYQVADMTSDADIPDVPADYAEYIAIRAALDGFMKDQREPSQFVLDKKKEYEDMLTIDSQKRDVSTPRMVRMVDEGDWGNTW